jgi:hypothetical protein
VAEKQTPGSPCPAQAKKAPLPHPPGARAVPESGPEAVKCILAVEEQHADELADLLEDFPHQE